jgi:hypothetical protein
MGAAPRDRLGIVSGMLALTRTVGQTTGIALVGAAWASLTFAHAGQIYAEGATTAPAAAQISGLQDVLLALVGLLTVGLALAVWALMESRPPAREALQAASQ